MQGRDSFTATGGECFDCVPALNANAAHVGLQVVRVMQYDSGWSETSDDFYPGCPEDALATTRFCAQAALH